MPDQVTTDQATSWEALARERGQQIVTMGREFDACRAELCEAQRETTRLEGFIGREGFRRCDIPACNCNSFHGGHAHERLSEIYEALGGCDGTTPLREIARLRKTEEE